MGSALAVAFGLVLSRTIAAVFPTTAGAADVPGLLLALVVLALARAVAIGLSDLLAQRGSTRIRGRLRRDLTARIAALGPLWTARERTGELVAVLTGGLDAVDQWLTSFLPARLVAGVVPVMVLLVVAWLDVLSALVLVFTGPVLLLLLAVIGGRAKAVTEQRFRELRWLGAFFLDMLQGLATLKLFGRSREQTETIGMVSRRYADTTMEVLRTAFQTTLVLEWAATIATALVAVEVGLRLLDGLMPFDRALAIIVITPEFFLPLRQLSIRYHAGSAGRTAAERIGEILDQPPPEDAAAMAGRAASVSVPPDVQGGGPAGRGDPAPGGAPDLRGAAVVDGGPAGRGAPFVRRAPIGAIRFAGVRYAYPDRHEALRGLDLVIGEGETLALIGPSGAGKTTVANLLLRFALPTGGALTVGGRELSAIPREAWLDGVAWVPQRPHLFDGTVADNLRLGRPDATDAELHAAVERAGADAFIGRLPRGFETRIGERGSRLSGGQAQRLAIARAWLRDARLVILDEATSHLDAASEARIRDAAQALLAGRTALVISHRHRLAAVADRVALLEHGTVTRTGPPDELLAAPGQAAPGQAAPDPRPSVDAGSAIGPVGRAGPEGAPA